MNINHIKLISLFNISLFLSCENSVEEIKKVSEQFKESVETVKEVQLIYSEETTVKVVLEAPTMLRHKDKKNPHLEFIEGMKVVFLNERLDTSGYLTANYGIRYEKKQETIIRDQVVWQSYDKNRTLETEELWWDEKKEKVFSEKFTKVHTPTETIFSEGFEANQDFTNLKFKKITGTIQVSNK